MLKDMLKKVQSLLQSFQLVDYFNFLEMALKNGIEFHLFNDFKEAIEKGKPYHFLKHDIHHDIERTFKIAKGEKALGIRATYFMMHRHSLNSKIYDRSATWDMLREIQGMGHEIALHVDGFPLIEEYGDLAEGIQQELKRFFAERIILRGGNTHGNSGYWQKYKFEPMSFYKEVFRKHECIDEFWNSHQDKYSLVEMGFHYWADTEVWYRDKEMEGTDWIGRTDWFLTDNSKEWRICKFTGDTSWRVVGKQFEIDKALVKKILNEISGKSCIYLIHPQFYF